jgi:hypothetical protein
MGRSRSYKFSEPSGERNSSPLGEVPIVIGFMTLSLLPP